MVQVFREVWRVLRDDGTVWLNIGDSYNGNSVNQSGQNGYDDGRENRDKRFSVGGIANLKPKDLIGIPWRLAFALQADGWYLRQDIIWHKPNPMPESVKDRCTKAHEYIFLLTKSARYYYDNEAVKEESVDPEGTENRYKSNFNSFDGGLETGMISRNNPTAKLDYNGKRNKRSVWTVTTKPYSGAHYAVFPPDLIEPCILAGCPEGGIVFDPFIGSGTTCMVARKHNRNAIGLDLKYDYLNTNARKRLQYGGYIPVADGVNQLTIGV
jgi:site-specific DNA-methyltransferase (adenine-specific)